MRVSEERPLDRLEVPAVLTDLGVEVGGRRPRSAAPGRRHARRHEPRRAAGRADPPRGRATAACRSGASWSSAHGWPTVPYLAVTGTNGKTTTVELLAACLRADGIDAVACGNVGHPFPLAAREGHEALVVEASSFQLRFADTFHPRVSVLLNLAPDHLDWHGSFEAYRDAKARIAANQTAERHARRQPGRPGRRRRVVGGAVPRPLVPRRRPARRRDRLRPRGRARVADRPRRATRVGGRRPGRVPRRRGRRRRGRAVVRRGAGVDHRRHRGVRAARPPRRDGGGRRRRPVHRQLEGDERPRGAGGPRRRP